MTRNADAVDIVRMDRRQKKGVSSTFDETPLIRLEMQLN